MRESLSPAVLQAIIDRYRPRPDETNLHTSWVKSQLENAGVNPLPDGSGFALMAAGIRRANEEPRIIERFLLNSVDPKSYVGRPRELEHSINGVNEILVADGLRIVRKGLRVRIKRVRPAVSSEEGKFLFFRLRTFVFGVLIGMALLLVTQLILARLQTWFGTPYDWARVVGVVVTFWLLVLGLSGNAVAQGVLASAIWDGIKGLSKVLRR